MVNIGLQDFEDARLAAEHLIRNGHRRIAFAGPAIRAGGVAEQRLFGFRRALEDHGVPFDPSLVLECEFSTSKMIALGERLAARKDITAVFATADMLAAGIMSGLQHAGRMVPRDISIIGFGDISWARMTMPMLTTIHQDAEEKGRLAGVYDPAAGAAASRYQKQDASGSACSSGQCRPGAGRPDLIFSGFLCKLAGESAFSSANGEKV